MSAGKSKNKDEGDKIRRAACAGSWYPGEAAALRRTMDDHFGNAASSGSGGAVAIIAPHAGAVYSGDAAAAAYLSLDQERFDRVVVLAPAHRVGIHGVATCSYDAYATPLGAVPLDAEAMRSLESESHLFEKNDHAHALEHSLEMQLPFMQHSFRPMEPGVPGFGSSRETGGAKGGFSIVPLVVGSVRAAEIKMIAETIREILDDRTAIVVSSDFTHYGPDFGFVPFKGSEREKIELLDKGAIETIVAVSPARFRAYMEKERPTICGKTPIEIALLLFEGRAEGRLLDYYTSADISGDRRNSVGYAAIGFYDIKLPEQAGKQA